MALEKFDDIYHRAAQRKGGEQQLESLLSRPLSAEQLRKIGDDRWLSALSMKVFQSGISWKVVRNKWPNFEQAFFGFKVEPLLMLSDEQWDNKAANPSIIRHHAKIRSIQANALMIHEASLEHGTFTNMVADWPRSVRPSPTVLVTIESVSRHCSRVILYRQWRLSS